jgi:hypothetical protein
MEASKRADFVRKIQAIEKKGKHTADARNKSRKHVTFQPSDMVWVQLRKDRFPLMRRSKLKPHCASPYRVLAKINGNAYSIDIPIAEFGGVSNSFNIADLSLYDGDDLGASRLTHFEVEGEMMRTSLLHSHLHQLLMIQLLLLKTSPIMRTELDQLLELVLSC